MCVLMISRPTTENILLLVLMTTILAGANFLLMALTVSSRLELIQVEISTDGFLANKREISVDIDEQQPGLVRKAKNINSIRNVKHSAAVNSKLDIPMKRGGKFDLLTLQKARERNLARFTTCDKCMEYTFDRIQNNAQICTHRGSNIDLLVLITTTHEANDRRDAIRKTWISTSQNNTSNIRYGFLLGTSSDETLMSKVIAEAKQNGDLIIDNFVDSYHNLTYKTLMGFEWAVEFCSLAKYVMKTDDDVYVNVNNVVEFAKQHNHDLDNALAGSCSVWLRPNRHKESKWYVSRESYPWSFLPPYCSGTGYVTSMRVVRHLLRVSSRVPFFHLEDVYVGFCLAQLAFSVIDTRGFNRVINSCVCKSSSEMTMHSMTPDMMRVIWMGKYLCLNDTSPTFSSQITLA